MHAQASGTSIAQTLQIASGTPASGDLISFNRTTGTYSLTKGADNPDLFGVVVLNPLLVLRGSEGGVPVVTSGEVLVNVTTLDGPIQVGDYITSSALPGKGERATSTDVYVVGTALQSFGATAASSSEATSSLQSGAISVLLNVVQRPLPASASANTQTQDSQSAQNAVPNAPTVSAVEVLRYLLAAFIAVGSVYAAFRNFGANITNGVVSIGRNPLAKSSIQMMVALNAALIVFISLAGLFVALVVLLMPL